MTLSPTHGQPHGCGDIEEWGNEVSIHAQVRNEGLQREPYSSPIVDDILPQDAKPEIFSKLDLLHGYWQCILDGDSSLMAHIPDADGMLPLPVSSFQSRGHQQIFPHKTTVST